MSKFYAKNWQIVMAPDGLTLEVFRHVNKMAIMAEVSFTEMKIPPQMSRLALDTTLRVTLVGEVPDPAYYRAEPINDKYPVTVDWFGLKIDITEDPEVPTGIVLVR